MPQFASPFVERLFLAPQAAFNLIPETGNLWVNTATGVQLLRAGSGCKIKADPTLIPNPVKTGTRSMQPGIPGRKSNNTWTLPSVPIIPSGVTLTVPDMDLLFQSIFGQAATSGAYSLADGTIIPFILARFQHGQPTLSQQFAVGCIVTDWSININSDIITLSTNGQCYWVYDSENFANEDTVANGGCKGTGGITAFPVEPTGTPAVLGTLEQGFKGTATFDSNGVDSVSFPLISADVKGKTGNAYSNDIFGTSYPAIPSGGRRMVSTRCTFQETDSSALQDLKVKAKTKAVINVTYQIGTVAGSIITVSLKGVQLAVPEYSDEASRVVTAFSDSDASASTVSATDEVAVAFT